MKVGIVGHAAEKFCAETEVQARQIIRTLLEQPNTVLVSGGCHMGGVDIYSEEIADELGLEKIIHLPKTRRWDGGYKQRNLRIVSDSDKLHVIVVSKYPEDYRGMVFKHCYHCQSADHIKSGGCWTGVQASKAGKSVQWHII